MFSLLLKFIFIYAFFNIIRMIWNGYMASKQLKKYQNSGHYNNSDSQKSYSQSSDVFEAEYKVLRD